MRWWRIMAEQVPVGELLSFVIGGGWGADEPADGLTACRVIRGADIPAAQAGDISLVPLRFETPKRLVSRSLRAGDIILEVSGGSKAQPTGRTVLVSERLLSQSTTPLIPASFCRLIRPDQSRVDSRYLSYWFSDMYRAGRTWAYQTQSTGIANFQMAVFEREEIVQLPPSPSSSASQVCSEPSMTSSRRTNGWPTIWTIYAGPNSLMRLPRRRPLLGSARLLRS